MGGRCGSGYTAEIFQQVLVSCVSGVTGRRDDSVYVLTSSREAGNDRLDQLPATCREAA